MTPTFLSTLVSVLLAAGFLAALIALGVRMVKWAKKGTPGAQVVGAVFLLFGMGNIRDPSNEIVQQAKELKKREEDDSGAPPLDEA